MRFGAGWSRFHAIWSHGGPNQSQNHVFDRSLACLCKALSPEAHGLFAGQKPPSAALAADKTSVVSAAKTSVVSAAKKAATAATSAATSDISIPSTTPWGGRRRRPPRVLSISLRCQMLQLMLQLSWLLTQQMSCLQPKLPTSVLCKITKAGVCVGGGG